MPVVVSCVPTQEGRTALRAAGDEAVRRRTDLVMLRPEQSTLPAGEDDAVELDRLRAAVESELDQAGLLHELRTVDGSNDPASDLIAACEEVDADLVVIGLRRRTPVGKLILGANAQRILLDAPCAVLAVKAPPTP